MLLLTESLGTVYYRAGGRAEKSRPNGQMKHCTIKCTVILKNRSKTKFLMHQSFVELNIDRFNCLLSYFNKTTTCNCSRCTFSSCCKLPSIPLIKHGNYGKIAKTRCSISFFVFTNQSYDCGLFAHQIDQQCPSIFHQASINLCITSTSVCWITFDT